MDPIVSLYERLCAAETALTQQGQALLDEAAAIRAAREAHTAAYEKSVTAGFTLDNPLPEVAKRMASRIAGFFQETHKNAIVAYPEEVLGPVAGATHVLALPENVLSLLRDKLGTSVYVAPKSTTFMVEEADDRYVGTEERPEPMKRISNVRICQPGEGWDESQNGDFVGRAAADAPTPEFWGFERDRFVYGGKEGRRNVIHIDNYCPYTSAPRPLLILLKGKRTAPAEDQPAAGARAAKRQKGLASEQ